jgi:hypothetical protein
LAISARTRRRSVNQNVESFVVKRKWLPVVDTFRTFAVPPPILELVGASLESVAAAVSC